MRDDVLLYKYCKILYLVGGGNYWHDQDAIGDQSTARYRVLCFALYFSYVLLVVLEILAATIGNLCEEETYHAFSFASSEIIILIKMFNIMLKQKSIMDFMYDLMNICQNCEEEEVGKNKYRNVKFVMIAYFCCTGAPVSCYIFRGLLKAYSGLNFYSVVTYYPTTSDPSPQAAFCRIYYTFIFVAMMVTMIVVVDGFVMFLTILLKYKFITLRHYFQSLSKENDEILANHDINTASMIFSDKLKEGIIMHNQILRISQKLDDCFGFVMAVQLFQSSCPVVFLLLQTTAEDLEDPLKVVNNMLYVFVLYIMLGLYLTTAGDITHQASLLANAIFYSGWHLYPSSTPQHSTIRAMVIMGCAQAQRPLTMKAFKMVEMTHATFVEVIKFTYSVTALFKANE